MQNNIQLLIIIVVVIFVNLIGSGYFFRLDLTKEKRYSLSDLTVSSLDSLDYPMYITVYLEGEFPPNIREFQDAIRTTLIEMKQYAGGNLEFEFVDPGNNQELLQVFSQRGIAPVPIKVQVSATETRQQAMWPIAVMRYREREVFIYLLKGATVMTTRGPNVDFVKAEADLEYKLTSRIRTLVLKRGGLVALLQGHGELTERDIPEWVAEIQNTYSLYRYDVRQIPEYEISPSIDVLIILQPKEAFSERDKYEIDQYLIRGGSVLWVINQQVVDMDMYRKQATLTQLRELNLDDMFMKYGVKVNYDFVQDLEAESTEIFQSGPEGGSFDSRKWVFYPLLFNFPEHPVSRNADAVLHRYANSIDTFHRPGITPSVFLQTSPMSRTIQGRQFIDVNEYMQAPPPASIFNQGPKITGVLLEGIFESLFANRQAPTDSLAPNPPVAPFGIRNNPIAPGKMIIISDDEFAQGKLFRGERGYMPYDNKTILMNAVDYLAGDEALTDLRSKEVVVRMISREKGRDYAGMVRVINLVVPILLILVYGFIRFYLRRRRNEGLKV